MQMVNMLAWWLILDLQMIGPANYSQLILSVKKILIYSKFLLPGNVKIVVIGAMAHLSDLNLEELTVVYYIAQMISDSPKSTF